MIHADDDQILLQQDLQVLYEWADLNNKSFNDDKFEHLPFGKPNNRVYTSPSGSEIKKKEHVKDLGVHMSGTCSFDFHINSIVKTAMQVSAWILRTFLTRDKFAMKVLLQSLVVSLCEYASVVWSPFDKKNINMIENVQKRFTSRIRDYQEFDEELQMWVCTVSYNERIKDLKIYSLERRRERNIIMYAYRVVIGLLKFEWFEGYEDFQDGGIKLRPKYNNRAPARVKRCRHSSFFYKGPQLYNLLPAELRQLEEIDEPGKEHVEAFKVKLDKFLEKIPDEPCTEGRVASTNSLICQIPLFRRQQRQVRNG